MKLTSEDQILDEGVRKKLIEEITGPENVARKHRHLRAHEIYKDRTKKWVIEALAKEFSLKTVIQMQNRASNISILRKVVNKLAQAYQSGVIRKATADLEAAAAMALLETEKLKAQAEAGLEFGEGEKGPKQDPNATPDKISTPDKTSDDDKMSEPVEPKPEETETGKFQAMADLMCLNHAMKKADRYLHLHKNAFLGILPESDPYEEGKNILRPRVVPPHLYDVVPASDNPERAMVLVLTDFVERNTSPIQRVSSTGDGRDVETVVSLHRGDRQEQAIANSPDDKGSENRTFIFWTDKYHFTCDKEGRIIPNPENPNLLNPCGRIPGVFLHEDQDGNFWAEGGDDLVDGAVMINVELTDLYTIKNVQGWGQPIISGNFKEVNQEGGPHNVLFLKTEPGDPETKFYYASSNPPLEAHMKSIEMTCALYLSTNNLSPTQVAGKLDATSFASGIAKMVEDAQSTEPVEDKQHYFKGVEPELWEIIRRWYDIYFDADLLVDKWKQVGKLQDANVQLEFMKTKAVITEKEKLENLKLRKDLGINTLVELIKLDNPDLDDKAAEKKLLELAMEKRKAVREAQQNILPAGGSDDPKASAQDDSETGKEPAGKNPFPPKE